MRKLLSIFFLFLSVSVFATAGTGDDTYTAQVQVVDSDSGEPLIGAMVRITGSDLVYYTSPDGIVDLVFTQSESPIISVSYISYQDLEVKLERATTDLLVPMLSFSGK